VESLEERLTPVSGVLAPSGDPTATPFAHVLPSGAPEPSGGPGQPPGYSPAQISQAYGFNQITFSSGTVTGDGSGQTIALIDAYDQPNIAGDLATFDAMYGLAAPPRFTKVNQSGGTAYPAANQSWGLEISLDVEWAHAIAPGANILLVEANSNSYSDLFAAVNYARQQSGVVAVSMSWGGSEWSTENTFDGYLTTPIGHAGITFIASTGDSGSSGAPEYDSISPNALAVGGTQLTTDGSGNYQGETGWSGSGGGLSAYESQPGYQRGVVTQSSTMRGVPDVAYDGSSNSPFAVYDTSVYTGWLQVYGTSAGAPQWAALIAIADQGRSLLGKTSLDGASQTLPDLYALGPGNANYSTYFHDVTTGSNGGYAAGTGYDLVTGLGAPVANQIVASLVGSSSSTGQGPTVASPAGATPNPVTGTTTSLGVRGSDPAGASTLTYTWSVTSGPAGAATPTFSVNGTNAAQDTTATFYQAGSYTFLATIKDGGGLTATSSVTVTVNQTLTSVAVTPGSASLADGSTQQFSASALDQFGKAMSTQPSWTWSVAAGGLGTVSGTGLYTAPSSGSGTDTIRAAGGGLTGSATASFGSAPLAPSNLTATAVSSHQVNLSWKARSGNQTGFIIQRSTSGGPWTQIANVGAAVISFSDTGVTKHKTYSYRVYAYNSFGNSPYSNTATVVTPGAGVLASPTGNDSPPAPASQAATAGAGTETGPTEAPSGRSPSSSGSSLLPARLLVSARPGEIDPSLAAFVLDLLPGSGTRSIPGTNPAEASATGIWSSGVATTQGAGGIAGQGLSPSSTDGKTAGNTSEAGALDTLFGNLWAVLGELM
jgi:hypothetical protein